MKTILAVALASVLVGCAPGTQAPRKPDFAAHWVDDSIDDQYIRYRLACDHDGSFQAEVSNTYRQHTWEAESTHSFDLYSSFDTEASAVRAAESYARSRCGR